MIDFVGKRSWFFFISVLVLIASIASLAIFGLKAGIDFSGGTSLTLEFNSTIEQSQLRQEMAKLGYSEATIQKTGTDSFLIHIREISAQERDTLQNNLETDLGTQLKITDYYSTSPAVGASTARNAGIAIIIAAIGMLIYMAWAFRKMPKPFRWGMSAVLALLHDVAILIGIFSLLGWIAGIEVDALFITAVLTVVGYSINNTVVVYDRIRENMTRGISSDFTQTVNSSIVETMGRCLNTSLTTVFTILALFLFGGATIHYFMLALLIGVVIGTYDSMCIAGELLVTWERGEWRRISTWLPFVKQPT
ncbi:MAG: protein translocase subunit SecF [Dehalococcoidia bacterium]|jgi:preprotein translocase subunit SecF